MYKKRQKRLTTKEIEDTLNCSDAEAISEYEGNEMDDIDDPGISGSGRITYKVSIIIILYYIVMISLK